MNYLTKDDWGFAISTGCIFGIGVGLALFGINNLFGISKFLAPGAAILTALGFSSHYLKMRYQYRILLAQVQEKAKKEDEERENENGRRRKTHKTDS